MRKTRLHKEKGGGRAVYSSGVCSDVRRRDIQGNKMEAKLGRLPCATQRNV